MYYCLIYNLNSSTGKKTKFIEKIINILKEKNQIDYFKTQNENEAKKVLKEFKKKRYDRLIIAGGDGSVSFAINELIQNNFDLPKNFAIGYIPAGTANILQAELGMSKNIKKIANTLMSNNLEKTNLVKINNKHFILMAGLGWDAQIVQSINSSLKKILGKIIFGIKGFQKFIFMNNKKIKVSIGGENILADWVLCSNSKYYAGHHSINDTNIFDNKVVTYIFKDLKRTKLLYYIYLILIYGDLSRSKSIITKYNENLNLDGLGNLIPVQIDGDNFGNYEKIDISISKKNLIF